MSTSNVFTPKDLMAARQAAAQTSIDNSFEFIKDYLVKNVGVLCGHKNYLTLEVTEDKRVQILLCSELEKAQVLREITPPEDQAWNTPMKVWVGEQVLVRFGASERGGISAFFEL